MAARFLASPVGYCCGQRTCQFTHLTLVVLIVCVTISTKLAAAQTATVLDDLTEIATQTEVVTDYDAEDDVTTPSTTEAEVADITTDETTPEPDLTTDADIIPGSTVQMRFTISNKNYSDIEEQTEKEALTNLLVKELESLYSSNEKFESAKVVGFRNGSIIVDTLLTFKSALTRREREDVVAVLFEKVFFNGTLGELQLQDLKVVNDDGQEDSIDNACDIQPCLTEDMQCHAEGLKCKARCADNKDYCLNNSTCQPNNDYIKCKCIKDYFGYRCDKTPRPPGSIRDENAYIGIIAAAGIAVILLIVIVVGCGYNRLLHRGKESDTSKLVPAENTVALEMLAEPPPVVGGVACQTIESFLLAKYMKHGVPPKPGFKHEIIQTNDSFLLAKAQREREAATADSAPPSSTPNGTGAKSQSPPALTPSASPEQNNNAGLVDNPSTEPLPGVPVENDRDGQGIANKAFVEDEGDIVPTTEVAGEDPKSGMGKKIIKV